MFKYFLPKGKDEYFIVLILIIFYFICSYPLIISSSINDHPIFLADTYLSFDTASFYQFGFQSLTPHPLIFIFTKPIIFFGDILSSITDNYKVKTLFIALVCNILVSLSIIYIYRCLKEIIGLGIIKAVSVILLYSVFSANIVLSFTIESFTLSLFFISFSIYYYSIFLSKNQPIPLVGAILIPLIIGGITITNFIIAIVPIIISNDSILNKLKKILIPSVIIFIVMISIHLQYDFIGDTKGRLKFFTPEEYNFHNMIDILWYAPMLLPEIMTYTATFYHTKQELISIHIYSSIYQYLPCIIITLFCVISIIKNYRNKTILYCLSILALNIFIHNIIAYGLGDGYIYCGHWISIIPIFLGFIFVNIKKRYFNKLIIATYFILFLILITNNVVRIQEMTEVAKNIFPAY